MCLWGKREEGRERVGGGQGSVGGGGGREGGGGGEGKGEKERAVRRTVLLNSSSVHYLMNTMQ